MFFGRIRIRHAALVASLALAGCGGNVLEEAPEPIRGTWVSQGPGYEGRAFAIEARELTIYRGEEGEPVRYDVDRVEFEEAGALTRYALRHRDESGEWSMFRIEYAGPPTDVMRLTNQPTVTWTREASSRTES